MNAYWMNELVYKGTACPTWLAVALFALVGIVAVGSVAIIALANRN